MKLDFSEERVLAVVAHPDDAELLCAGTLSRAKADGAAIGICVLCNGDKGQPAEPVDDLAAVRRQEMQDAAVELGAELFTGEIGDGELTGDQAARRKAIEVYRRFGATLVLAHDPNDYHPDHRAASAVAEAASWFSASGGHKTDSPPLPGPPQLWWMDTINMLGFTAGFYIDISERVELKRRMLACHRSQIARGTDSDFAPLQQQMVQQCEARGAQAGVAAAEAFRIHHAWKRAGAW
jgi:LmbE family N-acetylglucosaminyl deacetylase